MSPLVPTSHLKREHKNVKLPDNHYVQQTMWVHPGTSRQQIKKMENEYKAKKKQALKFSRGKLGGKRKLTQTSSRSSKRTSTQASSGRSSKQARNACPPCELCGAEEEDWTIVKTECCGRVVCSDKKGEWNKCSHGFDIITTYGCERNHEKYSVCYYHFVEEHEGRWQDCSICRFTWPVKTYVELATDPRANFEPLKKSQLPPTKMGQCSEKQHKMKVWADAPDEVNKQLLCERCDK